ncbi:hypothetical protein B0A49_12921 [Cryomyces minteri]|uniref:Xylanolytic transcriptional activator regulatory domain-containing protein n=1 Tax=Cryomyces minteri TaxID=331657 RepID=A0A4U0VSL9_9PEZI|nr:hypothetical protein B0A49_12921 [Cryomyces minteri]
MMDADLAVYHTECAYDIDSDHRRKGALKRDIESLRERNGALGVIVASIRSLPESDVADIVSHIRVDDDLDALAESLRRSVNLPRQSDSQTLEADAFSIERKPALSNTSDARQYGHTSCLGLVTEDQDMSPWSPIVPVAPLGLSWTSVTNDVEFINHLMNLYFAWPHPFYQLFSRECFLFDMQKGRTKYCSALLVNAILACSCHFSDRIAARAVPDEPRSAGDHFFAEAKRILNEYETPDLTTVQALGIMSVREASYGRDSSGYQYAGRCLRMALELGIHLSITTAENPSISPSQTEVRRITFWGCFNLDTFISLWSVCVGRIPQLPRTAIDLDKPTVVKAIDSKPWIPYTDTIVNDSQLVGQPSHTHEYLKQYSLLSELISDANFMFYAPRERLNSRKLLDCYTKYQNWLMALPHCLRLKNSTLSYVLELQ